jgi:hypothetical protein
MLPPQHNQRFINRKNGASSNILLMNADTPETKVNYSSRALKSRDSDDDLASAKNRTTKIRMEDQRSVASISIDDVSVA